MDLVDVNILVYAHRVDAPHHSRYLQWLEELIHSDQAYGTTDIVLSGFLRIVTHPRIFNPPSEIPAALAFVEEIRDQPNAVPIAPGLRHWPIFTNLCHAVAARGNLIPDAYLAALAIESGSRWITTDRDFSRFPGLIWRHPFDT
jgi:hypothetical protein